MKVLTEEQQLKERSEQLFKSSQYIQDIINKMENKSRDLFSSAFSGRRDKGRLMEFETNEYKKIRNNLNDYHDTIHKRLEEINAAKKPSPSPIGDDKW